jgi:pre-mRNA-processing factor 19
MAKWCVLCDKLEDTAAVLTAERKKRGKKAPEGLAAANDIRGYKQLSSHPV